jgi:hypothetical protein
MSDMTEPEILNLDALLGHERPVKVILAEREYRLLQSSAFGPRQIVRITALRRRINELINRDDLKEAQEKELDQILNEFLTLLCPDLPVAGLAFSLKLRIMNFYTQETIKNALATALRKIGATSPAG